jgi:1-acyl-sn-glycerol-3-phosphate acyltransferase
LRGLLAWLTLVTTVFLASPLLAVLPVMRWRQALVRAIARSVLAAGGLRVRMFGATALPHPCIVVANHASYLDGIVLAACLPPDFGFVIKREMDSVPLAAWLLRRIGAEFVERNGQAATTRDALRLVRHARDGRALAVFPEGTFSREPGLLPFHPGAFAAAARAGFPIVPTLIRGTRACLAPGALLPRPGPIEVHYLEPLQPQGTSRDAVRALRDLARTRILDALGEPDLTPQEANGHGIIPP